MTTKHMLVLAALACGSLSTALADNVYITGSSAFRTNVMTYLNSKITNKHAVNDSGKTIFNANYVVISGIYNSAPITVYCAWTGSVGGIQTVVGGQTVPFANKPSGMDTSTAYALKADGSPDTTVGGGSVATLTVDGNGVITSASSPVIPSFGFSDVFQESANVLGDAVDTQVAVLPFKWITTNGGQAAGITNMTPQIAQTLFKTGLLRLTLFTGNSSDNTSFVHALGRTNESGTRLTAMAETGVGTNSILAQFTPTTTATAITSWGTSSPSNGYVSGGTLAGVMGKTTTNTIGHGVTYLSVGDAATAITGGATELTHNGVSYNDTAANVIEGKYTFWCYEHLFARVGTDSTTGSDQTGQPRDLLLDFQTNLANSVTTSKSVIKLSDMHCSRATDGDTVFHN